jgi:hypothetical protein
VFAGKRGIGIGKKDSNETRLIQPFWTEEEVAAGKNETMRANDGGVDCKGRVWASAVCDPEVTSFAPEGKRGDEHSRKRTKPLMNNPSYPV